MTSNRSLKLAVAFALSAAASHAAFAQTPATSTELDTVIVTGSYIRGTATDAALPVDVITSEDLAKQGSPSTLDLLKSMPASNGVLGDTNQFDARAQGSEGTGSVNLRGFGPARTLVLLNGRRLVNSPFAAGVDTNMIPSAAIGRVEVLKDGAAATYGSDAIAGVVNFITRENFQGIDVSADYKHIADSKGDYSASVAYGGGGSSTHFLFTAGYQHRSELLVKDRAFASRPFTENEQGGWSAAGDPASFVPIGVPGGAGALSSGATFRDPQCATLGGYPGFSGATPVCYWQYNQFDALTEKEDRYQVYGEFNLNFGSDSKWHSEAFYGGTEIPIYRTSPSYAALQTPTSVATGGVAPISGFYTVPVNNPGYIDFRAKNPGLLTATGVPGVGGALVVAYRPFALGGNPIFNSFANPAYDKTKDPSSSQGPRHYTAFRVSTGVSGSFFEGLGYDTAITYMKQENSRDARDTVVNRLELALTGFGGPNCTGTTAGSAANNCFWLNPFSNAIPYNAVTGQANPQYSSAVANDNIALDEWLFPKYSQKITTDLVVVDAVLNGKTGLKLPGGDLGWAAGVQYRDTGYKVHTDDIANFAVTPCVNSIQQGTTNIGAAGCTAAQLAAPAGALLFLGGASDVNLKQNVKAVFTEVSLPFLESLQAQVAARYEDYGGETGSTFDPKLALRYQPIDLLTLRGSVGTTFRGPTAANVDPNTATSLQNIGGTFRAVRTSGNPALAPEKATTFNLGAIIKAGGFRSSLDYWNFDFKKSITVEPVAGIVNAMFPGGAATNCGSSAFATLQARFTFNASGCGIANITRLDITTINGSEVRTSGLDYSAQFDFDLAGGSMGIGTNLTYILKYDVGEVLVEGQVVQSRQDLVGFLNYQTTAYPLPKLKGNLFAEYAFGINNIRWQVNYVDSYEDQRTTEFGLSSPTNLGSANTYGKTIASTTLHSLYYQAKLPADMTLNLSVENIFNRDPSFARLDLDYDPFTGTPLGRTVKVGVRVKF